MKSVTGAFSEAQLWIHCLREAGPTWQLQLESPARQPEMCWAYTGVPEILQAGGLEETQQRDQNLRRVLTSLSLSSVHSHSLMNKGGKKRIQYQN